MIFHVKDDLYYLSIAKAGCTSVKKVLLEMDGYNTSNKRVDVWHGDVRKFLTDYKTASKGIIFCVTRNPYDRFVSFYKDKVCNARHNFGIKPKSSLESSISQLNNFPVNHRGSDQHLLAQHCRILNKNGELVPNIIIDISQLNDFWNGVLAPKYKLNTITKSENKSYASDDINLNKQQRDVVYKKYKKDFELLGYTK